MGCGLAPRQKLILAENDTVQVDAIAGTAATSIAPEEADQWGEKNATNNAWWRKSITGTLIDLGARHITVDGPDVLTAGPVAHLCTRITANVESRAIEELVTAVHPTPAVCGIPTDALRANASLR